MFLGWKIGKQSFLLRTVRFALGKFKLITFYLLLKFVLVSNKAVNFYFKFISFMNVNVSFTSRFCFCRSLSCFCFEISVWSMISFVALFVAEENEGGELLGLIVASLNKC